ncbi:MAG: hypothetical protein BJ554DRAFT_2888, partial [Olpidium bornovanus]
PRPFTNEQAFTIRITDLTDRQDRLTKLAQLVSQLPLANYTLLRVLIAHLINVVAHSSENKMTARNIGIVFSPTLGIPAGLFALMMTHFEHVFGTDDGGGNEEADGRRQQKTRSDAVKAARSAGKLRVHADPAASIGQRPRSSGANARDSLASPGPRSAGVMSYVESKREQAAATVAAVAGAQAAAAAADQPRGVAAAHPADEQGRNDHGAFADAQGRSDHDAVADAQGRNDHDAAADAEGRHDRDAVAKMRVLAAAMDAGLQMIERERAERRERLAEHKAGHREAEATTPDVTKMKELVAAMDAGLQMKERERREKRERLVEQNAGHREGEAATPEPAAAWGAASPAGYDGDDWPSKRNSVSFMAAAPPDVVEREQGIFGGSFPTFYSPTYRRTLPAF